MKNKNQMKKGNTNQKQKQVEEKHQKTDNQKRKVNIVKEIVEMIVYIMFLLLLVWLIITFVGQRTVVDGSSMYDTLEDNDNLWVSKISYLLGDPERFDIVVFPVDDEGTYYIKRIIGMPGERIRIDIDGTIYINDQPLDEDYGYETISPKTIGRADEDIILGEDEYFVMGDNRNGSLDSRFDEVGNIERERLIGKAVFRIWPLSKFGKIE